MRGTFSPDHLNSSNATLIYTEADPDVDKEN
jgi:hypothetical protein